MHVRPFEVLLLTNFSDACFRTIPVLAQMGDEVEMHLTIAHAVGDARRDRGELEPKIRSFFPEADHYASCRRVVVPGRPVEAIRRIQVEHPVDLVVAPAGERLGLPRFGHVSLRSRIVGQTGLPLLTFGPAVPRRRLGRPTMTVACCVEPDRVGGAHLRLAATYARRLNAALHVVQVLGDVSEASLTDLPYVQPLTGVEALRLLRRSGVFAAFPPEVHTTSRGRLAAVLGAVDADVVFLDAERWTTRQWLLARVDPLVDAMPCPAVCVSGSRADLRWDLPQNMSRAARGATTAPVSGRRAGDRMLAH